MLQLPFEKKKKLLQNKKLFLLLIVKITTWIEVKKYGIPKIMLSGYKKYEIHTQIPGSQW